MGLIKRKERVMVIGMFDLYNAEHALLLEKAEGLGDELYVGVFSDRCIQYFNGHGHPIYALTERMMLLRANKHVKMVGLIAGTNESQVIKGTMGLLNFWKPKFVVDIESVFDVSCLLNEFSFKHVKMTFDESKTEKIISRLRR